MRLAPRWHKIARYEDPEAWVRTVALRQVSNRRRKVRNGIDAVLRLPWPSHSPAASSDRVDLERALDRLPLEQRQVVVLDHLGLDGPAIARQLRVPLGTVKSRLSRARTTLAALLSEGNDQHVAGR